jgi:Ca2+-binding RTX toxin-like protein
MHTGRLVLRLGMALSALALVAVAAVRLTSPGEEQLLAFAAQPISGTGVCDVTGVHVGYTTRWETAPAPGRFVVGTATVDAIQQPTCEGAALTVTLRHVDASTQQTTDLATATTTVGSGTVETLTFASPPVARDVNDVFVELDGGYTPIPPECEAMKLKTVIIGTTGDDVIKDTKGGNLVYGLTGNDTITIGNQGDCVVGQDGDNRINGGNGDDVVLLGNGTNTVSASAGNDLVKVGDGNGNVVNGGNGEDTIHIGTGNDNTVDGGNGTKNVCHVPYPASHLAAHNTVIRRCTVVTP